MKRRTKADWAASPDFHAKWTVARAEAQAKANATGFDHGLSRNDLFKSFEISMLPRRENRCGRDLQCEVVSPETLDRCQPGHGPRA
jgi:hypothetical protein